MADKRSFLKKGYLSYFVKNAAGEYIYTGSHYSLENNNYGGFAARVCVFCAVGLISAVLSGIIPAPGMLNCFYVIIPFILEISLTFSVVWAAVRFLSNKKPLREYIYDATIKALPVRSLFAAIFSLVGIISETVFIILNGFGEKTLWCICLYFLKAASAASMLLIRRFVQKSVWIKSDKQSLI
ncbi:MAG: hypothetical protein J1E34_02580 [Oscillospiraceae bacterium]|nr:hypothetical protein [Oscillospiraceae bacterium]